VPFLSGYTLRRKITIDNTYVDSALTDFPLLVKITADAVIGANIDSGGLNIRFTSSDGTTLLKYERQSFANPGSVATGVFWVKVPTVAGAADTDIYVYYKGGSTTDGQDATNVWKSSAEGIYHAEQDPSGSAPQVLDSTSHARHGTSHGSMTSGDLVAGKVGYALDFDGSDDYIQCPTSLSSVANWTASCIVNSRNVSKFNMLFGPTEYDQFDLRINPSPYFETANIHNTPTVPTNGVTYLLHAVSNGANTLLYVNGVQEGSGSPGSVSATSLFIGTRFDITGNATYTTDGTIEECRFWSEALSDAWIKFEYRNIFEADNEIAFAAEESDSVGINADVPAGLVKSTPVTPTSRKSVSVPAGLIKCSSLSPQRTWPVAVSVVLTKATSVAPITLKQASVLVGPIKISSVLPTSIHTALIPSVPTKISSVVPATSKLVIHGQGLIEITSVASVITKSSAIPTSRIVVTPITPIPTKQTSFGIGLIDVLGLAFEGGNVAINPVGIVKAVPISITTDKGAVVPSVWIKTSWTSPITTKQHFHNPVGVECQIQPITVNFHAFSGPCLIVSQGFPSTTEKEIIWESVVINVSSTVIGEVILVSVGGPISISYVGIFDVNANTIQDVE
jgi:hypothetical protein